ncbi:MAG: acyltransferase [Candidatus Endonucleobacter bathymodioli]|uniref:Acyltransferase n=1 Tax=Candidatus Endonucleibacter bathymodioli TaxID=539814 RepID=A0AA90P1R7_9GAMM|nr:acyltransferase [Candidatus Endonucleobacter bathymodioli]
MNINRHSNNFDFLRLLFAVIVAIVHAATLSGVGVITTISQYISSEVAVDSFFVISGFLIFMSYESSQSLASYARKRIRRIFPGYIFVIIFCSIAFYLISSKTSIDYFNLELLKYIAFNTFTLNFLHPNLPGVFENNTISAVNGALWTIKVEVMFYVIVPVISIFIAKFKSYRLLILTVIYILSIFYSYFMLWLSSNYDMEIFIELERQIPGQLAFFISGAVIYYHYTFFYNKSFFLIIVASIIMVAHKNIIELYALYPISLAVIVLYTANIFKYMGNWGKLGDLSFGVYIWHFPIIQLFMHFNLFSNQIIGSIMLFTSILIAAYLSWHLIEKRYLHRL